MKQKKSGLSGKIFGMVSLLIIIIIISGCASAELKGARDGDLSVVREFVESGGDINERQKNGRTLLMFASAGGHVHIIDYLMGAGADLRLRDDRGFSALMTGVEANKNPSVLSLLSYGADVNDYSNKGQTSLLLAAGRNFSGIVNTLLKSGADYSLADNKGWTPFLTTLNHSASSPSGVTQSFMLISDAGASLSTRTSSDAIQPYKLIKNDEVSSSGASPSYKLVRNEAYTRSAVSSVTSSPLTDSVAVKAVRSGNQDVLTILFMEGIQSDIADRDGNSLLHYAINNVDMLQFLLKWVSDINIQNKNGETPLLTAVKKDSIDSVSFLLNEGADHNIADNAGWTPLLRALKNSASSASGLTSAVQLLQEKGARLILPSSHSDDIVFSAVKSGNIDVTKLLFEEGADVRVRDNSGNTLLHLGVQNPEMVRFLLLWKAAINERNNQGIPVLHLAAENSSAEVLNLLIHQEINIFVTDTKGNTALHVAALRGIPQSVRLLLLSGIFVNSTNSSGIMPYDLTNQNVQYGEEIRSILKTAGAIIPAESEAVEDPVVVEDSETEDPVPTEDPASADDTDIMNEFKNPLNIDETETETTAVIEVGESLVETEGVIRYSWTRINPSVAVGWSNRDKLTGQAVLILRGPEDNILMREEILIPMKGVNADTFQMERTVIAQPGQLIRGEAILMTENGKRLRGEVTIIFSPESLSHFSFENFVYE